MNNKTFVARPIFVAWPMHSDVLPWHDTFGVQAPPSWYVLSHKSAMSTVTQATSWDLHEWHLQLLFLGFFAAHSAWGCATKQRSLVWSDFAPHRLRFVSSTRCCILSTELCEFIVNLLEPRPSVLWHTVHFWTPGTRFLCLNFKPESWPEILLSPCRGGGDIHGGGGRRVWGVDIHGKWQVRGGVTSHRGVTFPWGDTSVGGGSILTCDLTSNGQGWQAGEEASKGQAWTTVRSNTTLRLLQREQRNKGSGQHPVSRCVAACGFKILCSVDSYM